MGVDHGEGGGQPPQNLERGDCPPDFVTLQNFKHHITCITMHENVFVCLYSRTFILSPVMRHPPEIPVRSTPMAIRCFDMLWNQP